MSGATETQIERVQDHSANLKLLSDPVGWLIAGALDALLDERAELLKALRAEAVCSTCAGTGTMHVPCEDCEDPPRECDHQLDWPCAECDETGISLKTDEARAMLDAPTPPKSAS